MDNARLRILVGLYFNCKEQLNTLKEQVEKDSIEIQVLNETGVLLLQRSEEIKDGMRKISLKQFVSEVIPEKLKEAHLKADGSVRGITSPANEMKIAYLEARLGSIKKLLGESSCQAIEKYEEERILKNK